MYNESLGVDFMLLLTGDGTEAEENVFVEEKTRGGDLVGEETPEPHEPKHTD